MIFGPLESQACGENNFTMKALGLLAFRPDLRKRFVQKLVGPDAVRPDDGDISILFFSRIGEGFFREAIERERMSHRGAFEQQLNAALGLPLGFRWRRNKDGSLTQPAKWQASHIEDMLHANGRAEDRDLCDGLRYLQDCLNTEPDIVLQWGRTLALIEIKVLSSEGQKQADRQMRLAKLLCELLGWNPPLLFFIGPQHGDRPRCSDSQFITWAQVAEWFSDVPEIADYIRSFAFFYHGHWQSMTSASAVAPGRTAYDHMILNRQRLLATGGTSLQEENSPAEDSVQDPLSDPWHYAHLGSEYFFPIVSGCKRTGVWPLRWIWLGTTGVPFAEKANGRLVNPNWMVEDCQGRHRTKKGGYGKEHRYDEGNMRRFSCEEIMRHFNLR